MCCFNLKLLDFDVMSYFF
uniref:Uncharacterized protein n=1 Tax=Lepeophtheirus salmonis TaxID=72036 RepID=A0A0K2UAH2_LEPSM